MKIVVLDLDQTLILSTPLEEVKTEVSSNTRIVSYKDVYDEDQYVYVKFRPGLRKFLIKLSKIALIVIWSMGQPNYVDKMVSLLPIKPHSVYNFTHCTRNKCKIYKSLRDQGLNNSLIVDDTPSYIDSRDINEYIAIKRWSGSKTDRCLYSLYKKLEERV